MDESERRVESRNSQSGATGDLFANEHHLRLAFESTGDGIWKYHQGTKAYSVSRASGEMLGYSELDFADMAKAWPSLMHPEDLPRAQEAMDRYQRGETPMYRCEYRMRCKNGAYKWVLARGKLFPSESPGEPGCYYGTHKDIDIRHRKDEEIQHLLEIQTRIVQHAGYAIICGDTEGLITQFNPAAERMLGYAPGEIVGKATPALWHDPAEVVARAAELGRELGTHIEPGFEVFVARARLNLPNENEWTFIRKDGRRMPVLLSVTALRRLDGSISGFLGVAADLTERKKADEEARERNRILTRALEQVEIQKFALDQHAIVTITDLEGKITYANDKFCAVTKYGRAEVLGRTHALINSRYHGKEFYEDMYRTLDAGKVWHGEFRNRAKDGTIYWVATTLVPAKDAGGRAREFISIGTDITDRKRNEETLRERQAILKATTESLKGVVMSCVDLRYRFLNFNALQKQTLERLFGHKLSLGDDFLAIIKDPEIRGIAKRDFDKCFAGEAHDNIVEYGSSIWHTRYNPLVNEFGEIIGASFFSEDISERKATELRQARTADRLSLACKAGGIGIWEYDLVKNALLWDDQMYALYGIPKDRFSGTYEAWRNGLHPEDLERSEREVREAVEGRSAFNTEFRVIWPDGTIHYIRALAKVVSDASGRPTHMIGTNWDITARKEAETQLQAAIKSAEDSNRAKSEFLSNMSHELRTPLNSVIGFSNILLKNKAGNLNDLDLKYLGRIGENGNHLLHLINSILDLSKIEAGRMELELSNTDVIRLSREVLDQFEPQTRGSRVQLFLNAPARVETIRADAMKLKQVLINLVGNALKFTESGSVSIRIEAEPGSGKPLLLEVKDTGIGIPAGRISSIFGAFQQADGSIARRFGGTGLGLTISKSFLTLMGFGIRVASQEGKGSSFTIRFCAPGAEAALPDSWSAVPVRAPDQERPVPVMSHGLLGKKVLIIDDEADSRILLRTFLEEFGCAVEEAATGARGAEVAREFKPDIITLDLMMPEEPGWSVARNLKADPALAGSRILVVSIIANEMRAETLGVEGVLEKPVRRELLEKTLADLVGVPK